MPNNAKLKIGITGGIGSGKTTVCRIFEVIGIPVYYSDERAKELINNHSDIIQLYTSLFGNEAYINGCVNRKHVADRIFKNKDLLSKVQSVVHPIVRQDFADWAAEQTSPMVINEAAILFESGGHQQMDLTITIAAPEMLRIQRIISRDNATEEQIRDRLNNQWTDEQRAQLSDFVIFADDQQLVIPQVLRVYKALKSSFH